MPLKDTQIRAFKPLQKSYRRADAHGLYVEVFPNGSKLWRWKYRYAGKEKRLALGSYPQVSLAEARAARDRARTQLNESRDPSVERKREKSAAKVSADDSFEKVAEEYLSSMEKNGRAAATLKKARWFLKLLKPAVGGVPIKEIDPQMLLAAFRKLEAKGNLETAKKSRGFASRVFLYAATTGRIASDPTAMLKGALVSPKAKHHAAILEPHKLAECLRAIDDYGGSPVTKLALQILPHVFVRPGELRHADWSEIHLDKAVWKIPAGRMKTRLSHNVPLSPQVVTLFTQLRELTGPSGYVFPALTTSARPMSENTINASFRRMGFTKDEVTGHGFRSTASSLLNESGKWHHDAIERSLSHRDRDAVRGAYHRGEHWEERVRMAAWWSDYLVKLKGSPTTN